jgi:hypothetical protein
MDFASIYRQALKDRAPALFHDLSRRGLLAAHVQVKAREASEYLEELIRANGFDNDPNGRSMAGEIAIHDMLEAITPDEDKPKRAAQAQFAAMRGGARVIDVVEDLRSSDASEDVHPQESPLAGPKANAPPDVLDCFFCPAGEATRTFARQRYAALARKLVRGLQRIGASRIYGRRRRHKTLWDEYCHEVQQGPSDDEIVWGWEVTLAPFLKEAIQGIPADEVALLTIGAAWFLDRDEDFGRGRSDDLIQENLERALQQVAGARNMSRFDPS